MIVRLFLVYARDAIAQQQIERDLCDLKNHLPFEPGYLRCEVWSQDDGLMVAFVSIWASKDDVLRFNASGLHSLIETVVELRIAGLPNVKLFRIVC
jgi:heme-degrading monooxygenase HmoA